MNQETPSEKSADLLASALKKAEDANGHLTHILNAFGKTLIEQARWKAELMNSCRPDVIPDAERFGKGVPLTDRAMLIRLGPLWRTAADRLIAPMVEGFPKISGDLGRLHAAVTGGDFSPDQFMSAAFGDREDQARELAGPTGIDPKILLFALTQVARPVVEKRSESLNALIKDLTWNRGYCPICGSFPAMSLLRGKEGQRWLRCGFCADIWRFHRTTCPFCDSQDPKDGELFFVEGREQERVEVCHKCKRYLIGIDMRNMVDEVWPEVAEIGLMHLDAIAQEKGFKPLINSIWTTGCL
jgi:FdhE protein